MIIIWVTQRKIALIKKAEAKILILSTFDHNKLKHIQLYFITTITLLLNSIPAKSKDKIIQNKIV